MGGMESALAAIGSSVASAGSAAMEGAAGLASAGSAAMESAAGLAMDGAAELGPAAKIAGGKIKQGIAFGIGNIIDPTGIGAITGTGFNSASSILSAKASSPENTVNEMGSGLANQVAPADSPGGDSVGDFVEKVGSNFKDGFFTNKHSLVEESPGDVDWTATLSRAAGKYANRKLTSSIGKNDAEKRLKELYSNSVTQ